MRRRCSRASPITRFFGGLALLSPLSYAVRDFYVNGGTQALDVRVAHADARAARIVLSGDVGSAGDILLTAASVGIGVIATQCQQSADRDREDHTSERGLGAGCQCGGAARAELHHSTLVIDVKTTETLTGVIGVLSATAGYLFGRATSTADEKPRRDARPDEKEP